MKTKPMLMSTTNVEAILEDRKTQTRRIQGLKEINKNPDDWEIFFEGNGVIFENKSLYKNIVCQPKVKKGDILWVRETFKKTDFLHPSDDNYGYIYKASKNGREWERTEQWAWKPSIFMPKEGCRLFLEVTNVRIERLNDISEDDAIAEGIKPIRNWHNEGRHNGWKDYSRSDELTAHINPINSFRSLWESINGKDSWNQNPWVWVYDFKRVEKPNHFL